MSTQPADLPAPGASRELVLPGPAGHIETVIAMPKTQRQPQGLCVVCHPHPLFGGTMTNKVVTTVASTALKEGLITARFNFRGVGRSTGQHDNALGETDDAVAVVEWLRHRLPHARLVLAGFSFGGYVSLKAAARVRPDLQISISVPFARYVDSSEPPAHPGCPWLAMHSTDDEVVDYVATAAALQSYAPPPQMVVLDGAGHFYHGRLGEIQKAVHDFINAHWPAGT